MKRLRNFIDLYQIYRHHYPIHRAALYAWAVSGEISTKKD